MFSSTVAEHPGFVSSRAAPRPPRYVREWFGRFLRPPKITRNGTFSTYSPSKQRISAILNKVVCSQTGSGKLQFWYSLVAPLLPARFRVVAIDWRGCGGSDKPSPKPDCSNYTIRQHAQDMLAVLGRLGIDRCHLATHSTGGIISTCMLLAEPERFQKVLALDPVGPMGLKFPPESIALLKTMRSSRENTRSGLALTVSTLFRPESLGGAKQPVFAAHATDQQKDLFERLVDNTFGVSDGIWFGTPASLNAEWGSGDLRQRQEEIRHEHLVLWGALDPFIPRQDMEEMATRMPNCRLIVVPEVGHSLLIERPELCAKHIAHFF
jgi:non-heme chloroperoxidase